MDELIVSKLDILIKLTATNVIKEDKTQTESILKLSAMGIGYKDIAKIIGTSDSYVALIISKNKNKDKVKLDSTTRINDNNQKEMQKEALENE